MTVSPHVAFVAVCLLFSIGLGVGFLLGSRDVSQLEIDVKNLRFLVRTNAEAVRALSVQ